MYKKCYNLHSKQYTRTISINFSLIPPLCYHKKLHFSQAIFTQRMDYNRSSILAIQFFFPHVSKHTRAAYTYTCRRALSIRPQLLLHFSSARQSEKENGCRKRGERDIGRENNSPRTERRKVHGYREKLSLAKKSRRSHYCVRRSHFSSRSLSFSFLESPREEL